METEKINRIKEALHKVKRAAYLAFRKDENNINNQHWEYEVQEAFELIEPLCYYDYEFVFGNSLTQRGLRNEVVMNLMNHSNERRFVMKETIWALFEPFANNNFDGEKTVCIRIFSYGEEVIKCTLLDVWENANYTIDFEKKVRGRIELEYLYYANTLALHMMEALQDIVEKGSFDAVIESSQPFVSLFGVESELSIKEAPALMPVSKEDLSGEFTIDEEKLKQFFLDLFFADDYKERDTYTGIKKLSRYDVFIEHLTSVLNVSHAQNALGGIAYMIHESIFTKAKYRGRYKFTCTLKLLFECCNKKIPADTSKNKYFPKKEMKELFVELGNPK